MQDILDEVKRDIKEERAYKLLMKYGSFIAIFMVLVVIVNAAFIFYNNKKQTELEVLGSKLHKFANSNIKSSAKIDKLYGELSDENYKSSSAFKLKKSIRLIEQGEIEESKKILLSIISNENSPIELIEIAGISYATNFEDEKSNEIIKNIVAGDGPFKISAQELQAYRFFDETKYKESLEVLKNIVDNKETPSNMKIRVEEAINYIEAKFVPKEKEDKELSLKKVLDSESETSSVVNDSDKEIVEDVKEEVKGKGEQVISEVNSDEK